MYDFPSTPAENQEFTPAGGVTYIYNAPRWSVKPIPGGPATVLPLVNATPAVVGTSLLFSRQDHVHPTDTSRASLIYVDAQDALKVAKAGDTMTGDLTLQSASPIFTMNSGATNQAQVVYRKNGVARWDTFYGADAESSGNAGSNLELWAFNDAGGLIAKAIIIERATCNFTIGSANAYKPGGGTWTAPSDERIKDVLGDYTHGLAEVLALDPVRYVYKGNYSRQATDPSPHQRLAEEQREFIGLIAQQAEVPMPEMVTTESGYIDGEPVDDLRVLDTTALVFALVNAVKELSARVSALEAGAARR